MSLYNKFLFEIIQDINNSESKNNLKNIIKANDFIIKFKNLSDIITKIKTGAISFAFDKFCVNYNNYFKIIERSNNFNNEQLEIISNIFNNFRTEYSKIYTNINKIKTKNNNNMNELSKEEEILGILSEMKSIGKEYKSTINDDFGILNKITEIQNKNILSIDKNLGNLINFEKMASNLGFFKLLKMSLISIALFIITMIFIFFDRLFFSFFNKNKL